jgi:hypothetical protein
LVCCRFYQIPNWVSAKSASARDAGDFCPLFWGKRLGPRLCASGAFRAPFWHVFDLAGSNLHGGHGVADHVARSLLAFWSFEHSNNLSAAIRLNMEIGNDH